LDRFGQLGLDCRVKRNVELKMEKIIGTWITNYGLRNLEMMQQMMFHSCMSRDFLLMGYTNIVIDDNEMVIDTKGKS
jgi:hypothetical protein